MIETHQYRKVPVTVTAAQMVAGTEADVIDWIRTNGGVAWSGADAILVETLEGTMRAEIDDWIIRGVVGEFYPCKPDVFAATYEPA